MISIIIPTTGRKELLCQCLERIIDTTEHLSIEFIVVVDNDTESKELAEAILLESDKPFVVDYSDEYRLSVGAMNAGLKHTRGEYIVGIGDDMMVEQGWLDEALRVMQEKFPDGDGMVGLNDLHQDGNGLSTTPLLTRKFIIKHLGGVWGIPHYKKWYGDVEMTARAKEVGRYAWAKNAIAHHLCPESGARQSDATDLKMHNYIQQDSRLCDERRARGWPCDYEPVIVE